MAMGLKHNNVNPKESKKVVYSDVYYSIGPLFDPIKKSEIREIQSVNDFNTKKENKLIESYESTALIVIENERQSDIRQYGYSEALNAQQLELLNSLEVSSHFLMKTEFLKKNTKTGELEFAHYGPHYTIVPEKQAKYSKGNDALLSLIKKGNKENTANLDEDKLNFAKLHFTISKNGLLTNVFLDRSSGIVTIDEAMLNLITTAPGNWIPAENETGENVDQELVITFGLGGC
jgi:hypothetical protein